MSLSPQTKKYHEVSPKELGLDPEKKVVMEFGIVRTTNHTGEQVSVNCPVYVDDTREALKDRLGFCYSVLQERLEEENEAINFINQRQSTIRACQEADKRNMARLESEFQKVEKEAKKHRWTPETVEKKREEIRTEADKAILPNALRAAHAQAELTAQEIIDIAQWGKDNGYEEWVVEECSKDS